MAKVTVENKTLVYPMPAFLIGANVDDKPNSMTAAWCGVVDSSPSTLMVSLAHGRHTYKGVKQNMTFSVNIPSVDLVRETDYCGIVSGAEVDKTAICKFKIFYGNLGSAPMIEQCPVNLECKVLHILNLGSHSFVVGQVEGTYVSENCLTKGKPDVNKIKPLIFNRELDEYIAFGEAVAKAYHIGQELKS